MDDGDDGASVTSLCRDPESWIESPQFSTLYRNFQVRVRPSPSDPPGAGELEPQGGAGVSSDKLGRGR